MTEYTIHFTGRTVGAQGVFYPIVAKRTAETPEKAIEALYDEYEHIQQPVATDATGNTHKPWQTV